MGADVIVPGLSSVTTGTCFASLRGVGLSSAQTSENMLTLCLHRSARPVSLPGDCATSIHLEGLPKEYIGG